MNHLKNRRALALRGQSLRATPLGSGASHWISRLAARLAAASWLLLLLTGCEASVRVADADKRARPADSQGPSTSHDPIECAGDPDTCPDDPVGCSGAEPQSDCSDPCAFCTTYECVDGRWVGQENGPSSIPRCNPTFGCDPLAQDCGQKEHCVLVDDSETFGFECRAPGFIDSAGGQCQSSDDCGLAAGHSMSCLEQETGALQCQQLCDLADPESGNVCGGECIPLAEFGYRVDGVGVCNFLGG